MAADTDPSSPKGFDAASWPQIGGPNRDGVATNTPRLLDSWPKDGPPLLWKSDFIPAFRDGGCASPVVADGKVFVFANKQPVDGGKGFRFITEKTLKQLKALGLSPEELARLGKLKDVAYATTADWAAAFRGIKGFSISHHISINGPLADLWYQSFVWSDTVYCLDAATGNEIWKKSFPVDPAVIKTWPNLAWGDYCIRLGSSGTPAVSGGKCYFYGSAGLYCLSAKEGSLLWQVNGNPTHASPLVANGKVYANGCAYDAETGTLRWKSPLGFGGKVGRYTPPVLWTSGGKDYVITTDAAGNMRANTEESSYVCLDAETGKVAWTLKSCIGPTIHDDLLVTPVVANVPIMQAYKMTPTGTELLWKGRFSGGGLVYQGHLYGGVCASLKTGEVNWKMPVRELLEWGILADGKIFGITGGDAVESNGFGMYKATPDRYVELGRFNPQACIMCRPATVGGKLYLRLKDGMACYDLQDHGVYLDDVTATKDSLIFRFMQTGGGLVAKGGLKDIEITDASGVAKPAQARIDGDNLVVDIKDVSVPFGVSCGTNNSLANKNGKPVPAFGWNEARLLRFRKAIDQTIFLKSDIPLQQVGAWDKPETFAVNGAKVTKVELDPQGKGVNLITDQAWKPGDALTLTYSCFAVDQGEPRSEVLTAKVVEVQHAAAKFVNSDTTTSGDWKGKYGVEGAMVAGDRNTAEAPKCATVEMRNCSVQKRWAQSDKDPAHLLRTGNSQGRSAEEWGSSDELFIDLEFVDGKEHRTTIYAWSRNPAMVEVLDADTKAVLDKQDIPAGGAFRYLTWLLKGNVMLHAVNLGSAEAAGVYVGGLFFDPAGGAAK